MIVSGISLDRACKYTGHASKEDLYPKTAPQPPANTGHQPDAAALCWLWPALAGQAEAETQPICAFTALLNHT